MELTTAITLTEGIVYNAMKEAIQGFFTNLPSQADNNATCSTSRLWGTDIAQWQACNRQRH